MNQKGHTLIEIIMVIFLMVLISQSIIIGTRFIKQVAFYKLVYEVEQCIILARDAAVATGDQYNTYCFSDRIIVRQGMTKPIYTVKMIYDVYIPNDITGKWIRFKGTMATSKAGTITLVCKSLGIQADITVRIATGKTTVYYRAL